MIQHKGWSGMLLSWFLAALILAVTISFSRCDTYAGDLPPLLSVTPAPEQILPELSGMKPLKQAVKEYISGLSGRWSVYVRNLETEEVFSFDASGFTSASLIKPFVMEAVCANMQTVCGNLGIKMGMPPDSMEVRGRIRELFENMIVWSDNDAFNELVCLMSDTGNFSKGAEQINEYLKGQGYSFTSVGHTLAPSAYLPEGEGENLTSAGDCGRLLEKVSRGGFIDAETSDQLFWLLLEQDNRTKIPSGLPDGAIIANKTGETSTCQHDIAIIQGPKTKYILCVLSGDCPEEEATDHIREIAALSYHYLE